MRVVFVSENEMFSEILESKVVPKTTSASSPCEKVVAGSFQRAAYKMGVELNPEP